MGRKYKPDNIVSNPQEYVSIGYWNQLKRFLSFVLSWAATSVITH